MGVSRRRLVSGSASLVLASFVAAVVGACSSSPDTPTPAGPQATAAVAEPGLFGEPRLPPGQHVVQFLPVLDLGIRPDVPLDQWRLEIGGEVENPVTLDWVRFQSLPHVERIWDFHCVTGWSRFDLHLAGVLFSEIVALVRPRQSAVAVIFSCRDGYTTNTALPGLLEKEAMLVDQLDGVALPLQHGAPVRGLVPWLYAWKSAKFVEAIRFEAEDRPGYWEIRGYHNRGDPWREERFG